MKKTNYLKLAVTHQTQIVNDGAVTLAIRNTYREGTSLVTSWIWTFESKADGKEALASAQDLRAALKMLHPELTDAAFQMSTFRPNTFRGVPVIGQFPRAPKDAIEFAEAS